MRLNTMVIDPQGREARVVTLPIPGRPTQLATLLYEDGHARLVDLAQCKLLDQQQIVSRSSKTL